MFRARKFALSVLSTVALTACSGGIGKSAGPADVGRDGNHRVPGSQGITDGVVKVTASFPVIVDSAGRLRLLEKIDNPVTIVNPASVKFALDGDAITTPPISNSLLDFGKLKIGELFDNNLRVCGSSGKEHCTTAYIQIYTTGTPGAGLWNSDGGYGMPLLANLSGTPRLNIGLGAANAAVVQTYAIASNKNVLRLTDFSPLPEYEMRADFTEAGAGSYTTTLVVEYGLKL